MPPRRVLLPLLVAACLLVLPGQALAAPAWLDAEPLASFGEFVEPAVATDANGNSIAAWIDQDNFPATVAAAYRPRGGDWEAPVTLEAEFPLQTEVAPRAVASPDGSFVVVWNANRNGDSDPVLRSATRSPSGAWTVEDVRDQTCCTGFTGLEAGGDGSAMVISPEEGPPVSNTKPSPGAPWGEDQTVGIGSVDAFAVGTDGGAVAVGTGACGESPCVRASHRPPGGEWGESELVGFTDGQTVTGLAVTANPDASFTVVWGTATFGGEITGPPGDVRSADRPAGAGQSWSEPETIAHLDTATPGCGSGCLDVASGAGGAQVAVWRENAASSDRIAASVRPAGGDWSGAETASSADDGNGAPYAAITTSGVPVVAWSASGDNLGIANASHRDGAGTWHPVELGSSGDDSVELGDLDADGDGNAVTAFRHRGGVFAVAFDAGGPRFSAFGLPAGGGAGAVLAFSAAADDNWSGPASLAWAFGDGTGAPGASPSHAYGAGGTFTATVAATDQLGNRSERSGAVAVTQPPPACGTADADRDGIGNACDDSNGAQRPRPFKTVNATVVSGEVFVKLPAGSASASQAQPPKGFVRLEGAETIPVGATLDTARGRVKIRSAATTGRTLQTGQFFRGRFRIRQERIKRRSKRLITDMQLTGSSFRRTCRTTTASVSQKRSKRRVRRLFGNAKGSFRTSGRNAAATVRGTRWSVQDRCDGTLVKVQSGRVQVRDKVRLRTVIVRTGRTYLARRR